TLHMAYAVFDGQTKGDKAHGHVYTARSVDGGLTFSHPVKVEGNLNAGNGASMAVAPDGTLYIAFRSFDPDNGIYVASSTDGGTTWSKPSMAAGGPGFHDFDQPSLPTAASSQFTAARSEAFPSIAVDRLGRVLLAWQENV